MNKDNIYALRYALNGLVCVMMAILWASIMIVGSDIPINIDRAELVFVIALMFAEFMTIIVQNIVMYRTNGKGSFAISSIGILFCYLWFMMIKGRNFSLSISNRSKIHMYITYFNFIMCILAVSSQAIQFLVYIIELNNK